MSSGGPGGPGRGPPIPPAIWLVLALHAFLLLAATVLYPTWRAPDEPQHVDMVLTVGREVAYPDPGERSVSRQVAATFDRVGLGGFDPATAPPLAEADAVPRADRPTWEELGPEEGSGLLQQMTQHPPLYYAALAGVHRAVEAVAPGELSFDQDVALLRVVSALMVLPLPVIAERLVRRLGGGQEAGVTAAAVVVAVPMLTHIGASVNNDNLLTLLVAVASLLLARVAAGDLGRRTALGVGVLVGLALLTKGFALALPPWIAAAYWVGGVRGGGWRRAAGPAVLALGVAAVVGGWWWVRNVVVHGALQPLVSGYPDPPAGFDADLVSWAGFFARRLTSRFWFEPDAIGEGAAVVWAAGGVLVALLVVGMWAARRRGMLADALVVLAPLVLIGITVLGGALNYYLATGQRQGIHGRYLYPALPAVAAVGALGAVALLGSRARWARWVPVGAVAGLVALHGAGLVAILRQYWAGDDLSGRVESMLAWAPWPQAVVVTVLLSGFLLTTTLFGTVVSHAARPPRGSSGQFTGRHA